MEYANLIEAIRSQIGNPSLKRFLLEQLEIRQSRMTQKQIDQIVEFRIPELNDQEQQVIRYYLDFFKERRQDQVEVDHFVRSLEDSIGKPVC